MAGRQAKPGCSNEEKYADLLDNAIALHGREFFLSKAHCLLANL
jgi:hypothetical protein